MPSADNLGTSIASPIARHVAINGLGLYAMAMYGITYYAVTTAAPLMAKDFGHPGSSVFAVLTVALLLTAGIAPKLGRLTDRFGAATVLLVGALVRPLLLAGMAMAPDPITFAAALLLVQVLGQATEYDATFAAAVAVDGEKARGGMSQITLWGGLASTAFWPATAFLLERLSWRDMFLLYAGALLIICVPVALLVRMIAKPAGAARRGDSPAAMPAQKRARTVVAPPGAPPFWLVAAAFALGGVTYNLPSLMLPVLEGLGLGASAVLVGMIFGPAQTAGRFCDMVLGDRVRATTVAVVASAMVAVALAVLLVGGVTAAIVFAVLFGAGAGVGYVVRGSVVLAIYGPQDYGTWLGRLGMVRLVVTALSPLGLAMLLESAGAMAVIAVCGTAAVLSLACFCALARLMPAHANGAKSS